MNIYPTIEALLHYAGAHLLTDELDYIYARSRIMRLLNLNEYEEYEINDDDIEQMQRPDDILNVLTSYAIAEKIIPESKKDELADALMDCVLKRPGEIADIFEELPLARGLEWLNDFSVKSGYCRHPQKKWESKSTKGKLEAAFSGKKCCCKGEAKKYPECCHCRENEGFKCKLNLRGVPLTLSGERMFFYFARHPLSQNHADIVSEYHRPIAINKTALNKMFDFVALLPTWFIATSETAHERYSVASKLLPMHRAADLNRFKSQEYPYINITTIDWYTGSVRLLCTNREKLIEYTDKLINVWKNNGGKNVAVSVRKIESKYCVEVIMLSGKDVDDRYKNITKLKDVFSLMGMFSLDAATEDVLKRMEKFLTKEERLTPAVIAELKEHGDMATRLVQAAGSHVPTALEASLDVKDEVFRSFESALTSVSAPIEVLFDKW